MKGVIDLYLTYSNRGINTVSLLNQIKAFLRKKKFTSKDNLTKLISVSTCIGGLRNSTVSKWYNLI